MNLSELRETGIFTNLDDGGSQLLDATKGILTCELIERIRRSKPVLILELGGEREVGELCEHHPPCMTLVGRCDWPGLNTIPNEVAR